MISSLFSVFSSSNSEKEPETSSPEQTLCIDKEEDWVLVSNEDEIVESTARGMMEYVEKTTEISNNSSPADQRRALEEAMYGTSNVEPSLSRKKKKRIKKQQRRAAARR